MSDQADGLRQLVRARSGASTATATSAKAGPRARSLVLTSGKGGVGTSNLALNLAIALGERGGRVVLVDADLGLANIDLLCGLVPTCDLGDVLAGDRTLFEAIIEGPGRHQDHPGCPRFQDADRGPRRRPKAAGRGAFEAGGDRRLPDRRRRIGPGTVDRHAGGGGRRGPGRDHARADLGGRRPRRDQPVPPLEHAPDAPGGRESSPFDAGSRRGARSPDRVESPVLRRRGRRPGLGPGRPPRPAGRPGSPNHSRPPIRPPPPRETSDGWPGPRGSEIEEGPGPGVPASSRPWRPDGRQGGSPDEASLAGFAGIVVNMRLKPAASIIADR